MTGINHPAQCRYDSLKISTGAYNKSYKPDANLHSSMKNHMDDIIIKSKSQHF